MEEGMKCQELYHVVWVTATAAEGHLPVDSVMQKQQQLLPTRVSKLVLSWMSQKLQGKKDLFPFLGGVEVGCG